MPVPVFLMAFGSFIAFRGFFALLYVFPHPVKMLLDFPICLGLVPFDRQDEASALPQDLLHNAGLRADGIDRDCAPCNVQPSKKGRYRSNLTILLFHRHLGKDDPRPRINGIQHHWRPEIPYLIHRRQQRLPINRKMDPPRARDLPYPFHEPKGKQFLVYP